MAAPRDQIDDTYNVLKNNQLKLNNVLIYYVKLNLN